MSLPPPVLALSLVHCNTNCRLCFMKHCLSWPPPGFPHCAQVLFKTWKATGQNYPQPFSPPPACPSASAVQQCCWASCPSAFPLQHSRALAVRAKNGGAAASKAAARHATCLSFVETLLKRAPGSAGRLQWGAPPAGAGRALREPAGRRSAGGPVCAAGCCSSEQPPQKQSPGTWTFQKRDVAFKHEFRNPHGSSRPAFLLWMSLGYLPSDCSIRKARLGVRHLLGNTRHNLYTVFNSSGWDLLLGTQLFLPRMRCSDLVCFICARSTLQMQFAFM